MNIDVLGVFGWVVTLSGSIAGHIVGYVFAFGVMATGIVGAAHYFEHEFDISIGIEVAPYEIAGASLSLLLIVRTNAGYDRWWEARKLWGGIINQSRNLVITGLSYGPEDSEWRENFVRWASAFPHIARCSLRGEPPSAEILALIGSEANQSLSAAGHMPSVAAMRIADLLREARVRFHLDDMSFLLADKERSLLIDHIGACERILKTPLPLVFSIKIRRFITLFLLAMPFALLHRIEASWLVPLITMLVAYPVLALDQIGCELQNPFSTENVNHLPLDQFSASIEKNLKDLLRIDLRRQESDKPM